MIKVSEIIGKKVISIFDGKLLGVVNNVVFSNTLSKIEWVELFDDELEKSFVIEGKNIYSVQDVITTKNSDCLIFKDTTAINPKNPINYNIYTTKGEFFGKICDICLNDKLKTENFDITNGKVLSLNDFLNVGNDVAILQNKDKKTKLSYFKTKIKFSNNKNNTNTLVTIENFAENQNKIRVPKKVLTSNYNFLIGRKLDKNLYSDNKQLLVKKQTTITSQIIDIASKNGKLKELTNSSIS